MMPPRPAWLGPQEEPSPRAIRRARHWAVRTINQLRTAGLQPDERLQILVHALAHEMLLGGAPQAERTLAYVQALLQASVRLQAASMAAQLAVATPEGQA